MIDPPARGQPRCGQREPSAGSAGPPSQRVRERARLRPGGFGSSSPAGLGAQGSIPAGSGARGSGPGVPTRAPARPVWGRGAPARRVWQRAAALLSTSGFQLAALPERRACGPFSSHLRGAAVQVAGNSLPEARPRCSQPATGLAAGCIHLQLCASPHCVSLTPCQGWQWTREGRGSPLSPPPSGHRRAPGELPGTPRSMGSAPAALQFNHPQVFKIKSIKIQRYLPNGESQKSSCLSCISAWGPKTTPSCSPFP